MKKNIFGDDQNFNTTDNDNIINLRKRRVKRIYSPDGSYHEFILGDTISMPDGNGGWTDSELSPDYLDDQGNPLPKDFNGISLSHTGRLVPPNRLAMCISSFHLQNVSRNIYVDVDGSILDGQPICSACLRRKQIMNIILTLIGIGFLLGFYKAFGWF